MTTKMAIELLLWILLAFSLIICALEIICVVLYRRLIATRKMLNDTHSSRPKISATIPVTNETISNNGNIPLSQIAGNMSAKGGKSNIAETKIPVTIAEKMKQGTAIILRIDRIIGRLKHYVNQ